MMWNSDKWNDPVFPQHELPRFELPKYELPKYEPPLVQRDNLPRFSNGMLVPPPGNPLSPF